MNDKRIVLGYCGDAASLDQIAETARTDDASVVAVAFDLGTGSPLGELRDRALAAGAVRCHAVDVREEFLRDYLLPALRARQRLADAGTWLAGLARTLVNSRLAEIAAIENAAMCPSILQQLSLRPPSGYALDSPASVEIRFVEAAPAAVNGIPMSLVEIVESLETITSARAIDVLDLAYAELAGEDEGAVRVRAARGRMSVSAPATVR